MDCVAADYLVDSNAPSGDCDQLAVSRSSLDEYGACPFPFPILVSLKAVQSLPLFFPANLRINVMILSRQLRIGTLSHSLQCVRKFIFRYFSCLRSET